MPLIETRKIGRITVISITRPERRNAITGATAFALRQAFLDYDADESQRLAMRQNRIIRIH
jgi:enoyl-CoA hydratase